MENSKLYYVVEYNDKKVRIVDNMLHLLKSIKDNDENKYINKILDIIDDDKFDQISDRCNILDKKDVNPIVSERTMYDIVCYNELNIFFKISIPDPLYTFIVDMSISEITIEYNVFGKLDTGTFYICNTNEDVFKNIPTIIANRLISFEYLWELSPEDEPKTYMTLFEVLLKDGNTKSVDIFHLSSYLHYIDHIISHKYHIANKFDLWNIDMIIYDKKYIPVDRCHIHNQGFCDIVNNIDVFMPHILKNYIEKGICLNIKGANNYRNAAYMKEGWYIVELSNLRFYNDMTMRKDDFTNEYPMREVDACYSDIKII